MTIRLSKSAADYIQHSLKKRGKGLGIRLGVKTSGCSGFGYVLEYADERHPDDEMFSDSGVSVFIDPKNLVYLAGTELDFVKEGLNQGFKFNNPKAKNECGCGESFSV